MNRPRHRWTEEDDIVALYLSRHGTRFLPIMEAGIAKLLGIPEASLGMRRQNFHCLDGQPGLTNAAELSRQVHRRYGKMPGCRSRIEVLEAKKEGAIP